MAKVRWGQPIFQCSILPGLCTGPAAPARFPTLNSFHGVSKVHLRQLASQACLSKPVSSAQEPARTKAKTIPMSPQPLTLSLSRNSRHASLCGTGRKGKARLMLQTRACQSDGEDDQGSRCDAGDSTGVQG